MNHRRDDDEDRLGFDQTRNYLTDALSKFVPRWLARRALRVSVDTDRDAYALDEPVEITVEFKNLLPVPVVVYTPAQRLWVWTVDGELAASDERLYTRERPGRFTFRGGERKTVTRRWNGRFRRTDDGELERWELPEAGEHVVAAYVATGAGRYQPRDETTIVIRE